MINENKLKEFLRSLMVWTDLSGKPDVHRILLEKLDDAFPKQGETK